MKQLKGNIKIALMLIVAAVLIGLVTFAARAAYEILRPINQTGGRVNQFYLWAEETVVNGQPVQHRGLDFSYGTGTNVYAVADGTVVDLEESLANGERNSPWGNFVLLQHDDQHYDAVSGQDAYVYSMFLHLSQNSVNVGIGQSVSAGSLIAQSDDTGSGSSGPHLHMQIVIHPQANGQLTPYSTIDSENRSRNPENWLATFNSNTARVVGRLSDSSGDPQQDAIICWRDASNSFWTFPKPYGSYIWSRTYSYPWANPDDLYGENFGTTDMTPGTYQVYAFEYDLSADWQFGDGDGYLECGESQQLAFLGPHTLEANRTNFIGLHPVYLPGIRSSTSSGTDSEIHIRNNSSNRSADVITSILSGNGRVREQMRDQVPPNGSITIDPGGSFIGSAIVVGSQDISVVATYDRGSPESYSAYRGIRRAENLVHVPILHRNNNGWYSRIRVLNTGHVDASLTVGFKPFGGIGTPCTLTHTLPPHASYTFYLSSLGTTCVGNKFVGSAYISSSEPIAVTWEQYVSGGASLMTSGSVEQPAGIMHAPLIQNFNSGWVSGISMQNAGNAATSLSLTYRFDNGSTCHTKSFSNVSPNYAVMEYPPPGSPPCSPFLSAQLSAGGSAMAANINQIKPGTQHASDYPAISTTGPLANLPFIDQNSAWQPGVLVYNPNLFSVTVRVRFYNPNGSLVSTANLPPIAARRAYALLGVPNSGSFQGSAQVEVLSPSQAPVAVVANHLKSGWGSRDLLMSYTGDP